MQRKHRKRQAHKNADRLAEDAWAAVERGELLFAERCMKRAVGLASDSPKAWTDYARVLTLNGRLKEAEKAARSAILIAPAYDAAYVALAEALSGMGLTIQAYKTMEKAVEIRPQVPIYQKILLEYEHKLPADE